MLEGIFEATSSDVIDNRWCIWICQYFVGLGPDYCILTIGPKILIFDNLHKNHHLITVVGILEAGLPGVIYDRYGIWIFHLLWD